MKSLSPSIPLETYTAARKVYNIQHVYLRIGDQLNQILNGIEISLLDPSASINYPLLFRLALVTAFQYAESLPDPLAVEAVRQRMDWKYALYMPVNFPGIPASALCGFRANLFLSPKGQREYEALLKRLAEMGLLARKPVQPEDSLHVFTYLCALTRLYWLNQGMRAALSMLGTAVPDWLRAAAPPHWYEQYKKDLPDRPGAFLRGGSLEEEANRTGADVFQLLEAVRSELPEEIWGRLEMRNLKIRVEEQFARQQDQIVWQPPGCGNCLCNYPLDSHL